MRQFIFRFSPWLALLAAVGGWLLLTRFPGIGGLSLGGLIAGVLGFVYFVQQQGLEETRLFKELFTEFNARYDKLNEQLEAVRVSGTLSADHRDAVVDYFNLCAEEYLFYKRGFIPQEVWTAWCRGMVYYLEREPFASLWAEEVKTGSYYGLTTDVIRTGAAMRAP